MTRTENILDKISKRGIVLGDGILASFGAVQTTISRVDAGSLQIGVADMVSELEPGTDAALVASNFATVTALEPLCSSDAPLGFDALAAEVDGR